MLLTCVAEGLDLQSDRSGDFLFFIFRGYISILSETNLAALLFLCTLFMSAFFTC